MTNNVVLTNNDDEFDDGVTTIYECNESDVTIIATPNSNTLLPLVSELELSTVINMTIVLPILNKVILRELHTFVQIIHEYGITISVWIPNNFIKAYIRDLEYIKHIIVLNMMLSSNLNVTNNIKITYKSSNDFRVTGIKIKGLYNSKPNVLYSNANNVISII